MADVLTHDAMLLAGGGYFGDDGYRPWVWTARMGKHIGWISTASLMLRRQSGAFCVGSGPLHNGIARRWAAWYANRSSYFSVRDVESQDWMIRHGALKQKVILSADAAILASDLCPPQPNADLIRRSTSGERRKVVGVHLQGLPKHYDTLHRVYKAVVGQASKNGWETVFLIDNVNGTSIRDLAKSWGNLDEVNSRILACDNAIDFLKAIQNFDLVVTSKLHVGVCSVSLGVPVIAIPWHMKTPRFYDRANLSRFCVPIESGNAEEQLCQLLNEAFTVGLAKPTIPSELRVQAEQNCRDVGRMISKAINRSQQAV